jgi:hypothetical protein
MKDSTPEKIVSPQGDAAGGGLPAKPVWLGDIACQDPKLAYTLLRAGKVSAGGYVDTGGWEIINLKGRFTSTAADQPVQGQLFGIVEADLWVRRVTYTVKRPNAFAGNIFKAQSDYYNRLNPNIDFTLIVNSYCRYTISPEFTPLENIESVFECVCPAGLILRCSANLVSQFVNTRTLQVDEVPTEAVITFHAMRLPMEFYGTCNGEMAVEFLKQKGYLPAGYGGE